MNVTFVRPTRPARPTGHVHNSEVRARRVRRECAERSGGSCRHSGQPDSISQPTPPPHPHGRTTPLMKKDLKQRSAMAQLQPGRNLGVGATTSRQRLPDPRTRLLPRRASFNAGGQVSYSIVASAHPKLAPFDARRSREPGVRCQPFVVRECCRRPTQGLRPRLKDGAISRTLDFKSFSYGVVPLAR